MNQETFPGTGDIDFDRPPEQDLVRLFGSCTPIAPAVDVELLLPEVVTAQSSFSFWTKPRFRRLTALAVSTICIAAVIAAMILAGSGNQFSFAAVQEKVAQTRSVTFKQTVKIDPNAPAEIDRMLVLAEGLLRRERPNGNYTVMDIKAGKAILVSRQDKKAAIFLGMNLPSRANPYKMLRGVVNETSKRLADEVIGGRKVAVFQAEIQEQKPVPHQLWKVWADPETKLPIRMEPIPKDKKEAMTIYDFSFDEPLDRSLFSFDPPRGYAVTTEGVANLPAYPTSRISSAERHSWHGAWAGEVRHVEGRGDEDPRQARGRSGFRERGIHRIPVAGI